MFDISHLLSPNLLTCHRLTISATPFSVQLDQFGLVTLAYSANLAYDRARCYMRRYYSPSKTVEYAIIDAQTAEALKLCEPLKEGDENYDPNLPTSKTACSTFEPGAIMRWWGIYRSCISLFCICEFRALGLCFRDEHSLSHVPPEEVS